MKLDNITNRRSGLKKRQFADACGLAHGMDLVGERWALLIMRELLLGPRRFSDLRMALPGLSANILTQRLGELEARHIVERLRLPPPANVQLYGLTSWGLEAEPMILAIAKWAYRSPGHDRMLPLTGVAMLLSLRINLDSEKAGPLRLSLGFDIEGTPYRGRLADATLHMDAGVSEAPDLSYHGTARGLAAHFYGKAPLAALAESGALTMTGDTVLESRFAALFNLPAVYVPQQKVSTPQS
jgi:DNA-binding HxlR family transcriptional regulator